MKSSSRNTPKQQGRTTPGNSGNSANSAKRASERRPAKAGTPPPNAWKPAADDSSKAHMHDRLSFLFGKSVGQFAVVTVANGARFRGVLAGATTDGDLGVVLKCAVKYAPAPGEEDEDEDRAYATLAIPPKELADVVIEAPDLAPDDPAADSAPGSRAQSAGFKTDTDISAAKGGYVERELERWTPDEGELGALEDFKPHSGEAWDQFAVNRDKFGVESTYNEHYYTTAINKSAPNYREIERKAEKLAAEIENSGFSGNIHIAEERGIKVDDSGLDEEDKYSGVARGNRYTPPHVRPSEKPAGMPYDPAIISSSLVAPAPKGSSLASPAPKDSSPKDSALPASVKKLPLGKEVKGPSKIGAGGIEKELAGNFRQFVSTEYERLNMKKQYMQNKQKSERLQDFKKFSEDYKIKAPLPPDLIPILAKGKEKQDEIRQKSAASSPEVRKAVKSEAVKSPVKSEPVKSEAVKSEPVKSEPVKPEPVKPEPKKTSSAKKPIKFNFNVPQFKPNPSAHSFTPGSFASPKPPVSPQVQPPVSPQVQAPVSPARSPLKPQQSPAIQQHSRSASPHVFVERPGAKSRAAKFNPFLQGKWEFDAKPEHAGKSYTIERAFVQGPTWAPGPSDRGYLSMFSAPDAIPRFGPSPQAGGMAFPAMPMMQPGFDDPNLRPMMATSPPPPPGQMVPGFMPNMGYPQYMPQYAPQYFRPQGNGSGPFMASPQMMGQAFPAMGYVPQATYSPGAQNAMVPPPVPQYYSPQQSNDASHQGSPE